MDAHAKTIIESYREAAKEAIAETLWPTRCAICDAPGDNLCDECASTLPFIDITRACPRCGAPHGRLQCTECNPVMLASFEREEIPFDRLTSVLVLDERTRRIVTTYKDRGERALARVMAELMARYVPPEWRRGGQAYAQGDDAALVTFVPATRAARKRRGFDHAQLLAGMLAENIGAQSAELFVLPKTRDQRKLTRGERLANMKSTLCLIPGATAPARAIVVDDVCTTGATMFAAADELRRAGTREILGITLARAW